jgi:hypothetical protein
MRDNPGRHANQPAKRRVRLLAPLTLLVACSLLAIFAAAASASNYDMRGEWSLENTANKPGSPPISGTDLINKMEPGGEFSGSGSYMGILPFAVSGTVSGNETSITVATNTPSGMITFVAKGILINTTENKFTGSGTYYNANNEPYETGEVICIRLKNYQEVIEREERERREAEEARARKNVRGEWEIVIKAGPQSYAATALVTNEANSKNEFASSRTTFEGGVQGSFEGTLEGEKATIKVISHGLPGTIPAAEFTGSEITVATKANPASMTGTGKFLVPEFSLEVPAEVTAKRIHTLAEVQEREATEARKAKEKVEMEAREAEEATARRAREEREAAERAASKAPGGVIVTPPPGGSVTLLSATPSGTGLTATGAGALPLHLSNPNAFPIHGRVTVVAKVAGAAGASGKHGKTRTITLGTASFTLAAHASEALSVKLTHAGLAALRHQHTLHVTLTVTCESAGAARVSGKYPLTLHVHAHHGKA